MIIHQQFANRFRHPISRPGRVLGLVAHRFRHVLPSETGDAAREHPPGPALSRSGGFEHVASPIEIDPQSIVESLLTLTADHGSEMKNRDASLLADCCETD